MRNFNHSWRSLNIDLVFFFCHRNYNYNCDEKESFTICLYLACWDIIWNRRNYKCSFWIESLKLKINFILNQTFHFRPMASPVQSLNPLTWVRSVPSKFPRKVAGTFPRPSRSSRPTKPSSSKPRTDPTLRSGFSVCQWRELTMRWETKTKTNMFYRSNINFFFNTIKKMRSFDNKIENTLFVHFQRYHKFVFEKVIFEDFKF